MAPTDLINRSSQRSVPVWLFVLAAVLIAGRVAVKQFPADTKSADLVKWVGVGQARDISQRSGKLIMYEFTADWCPPCRRMESEIFRDEELAQRINNRFVPVKLTDRKREEGSNPPHVERLQRKYSVNGFPTIVFVDAEGNLKRRLEGYGGRAAFEETIATIAR